jgi:excinuclease ABC subunit B
MYADHETDSMRRAIGITRKRRELQQEHNRKHGITPRTISKAIQDLSGTAQDDFVDLGKFALPKQGKRALPLDELPSVIARLKTEMMDLAEKLEFEKAAAIRDRILELEQLQLDL